MANYPNTLPSSAPATHVIQNDEVVAVAAELGINPKGSFASVLARLNGGVYTKQASFGNVATIAQLSSGSAAPAPAVSIIAPYSGRLFWVANCWLRNTVAGSLTAVSIGPLLNGVAATFTSANGAPSGSMSITHTGYHDIVSGTTYTVTAQAATNSGSGTWAFDAVTVNFYMGTLLP